MSKKNKHKLMMSGMERCPIDTLYTGPLEKHHINGRDIRNSESDWNIVYISPNTHRLVHEGIIIIEGWFNTSTGRELIWHKVEEEGITGQEAKPHIIKRT
jgi:hypothetical protein